ncbi:MAG: sulfite exporter TauE/SafE family protein [Pyrinomonadaceae bacterium]|nr:sulfite exporter TauE/SafE family protein [Pyrinomonadaceae bacterium]
MNGIAANLQEYLSAGSLLAYPAAFLAGLLISFTPCVYPIIPIQLGFIGGRVAAMSVDGADKRSINSRGFVLSLLFVIGMALVYAALGAFASLTGTLFGIWAASPWTYIIVGNIVLLLALSMLDVFTLPTPQFLTNFNPERKGNGYVAALLVGASSGLVVGPCTAPGLGAALAYVGAQGNVLFGTTILFTFALGMGALMIVLGTFGGALLPRSGAWMVKVKKAFGVIMVIVAEYLLLEAGKRFI